MIHSKTDNESVQRILKEFPTGNIRVVVATVAFGLGIQVNDVDVVINWGVESLLIYWQEVGRCARDGHQGYSIMYAYPRSLADCKDDTIKTILSEKCCVRERILASFKLPGIKDKKGQESGQCDQTCTICKCSKCLCCTFCALVCKCKGGNVEVTSRLLSE